MPSGHKPPHLESRCCTYDYKLISFISFETLAIGLQKTLIRCGQEAQFHDKYSLLFFAIMLETLEIKTWSFDHGGIMFFSFIFLLFFQFQFTLTIILH